MVRRPKSAIRAWPPWSIRMLALRNKVGLEGAGEARLAFKTYPLQVAMHHSLTMHVYQPPSDVFELLGRSSMKGCGQQQERRLTSSNRSTSLWDRMNSFISPFPIHSDTITNCFSSIVTPNRGNTFGWLRVPHLIASLQNLCVGCGQLTDTHSQSNNMEATYPSDFAEVIRQVHPQDLGCDSSALMTPHPHVRKPTLVVRDLQPVVTKRDLKGFREEGPAATYAT